MIRVKVTGLVAIKEEDRAKGSQLVLSVNNTSHPQDLVPATTHRMSNKLSQETNQ